MFWISQAKVRALHAAGVMLLSQVLGAGCAAEVIEDPGAEAVATKEQSLSGQSYTFWRAAPGSAVTRIRVCFEPYSPFRPWNGFTSAEKETIKGFAADWEVSGGVDFVFTGDCSGDYDGIRVGVSAEARCYSKIGTKTHGVVEGIRIGRPITRNCVAHEFGHALGFTHEQERVDNNGQCNEDQTQSEPDFLITPYNNNSIMSYCNTGNGQLTLWDALGNIAVYGGPNTSVATGDRVALWTPIPDSPFDLESPKIYLRTSGGDVGVAGTGIKSAERFTLRRYNSVIGNTTIGYNDVVEFVTPDARLLKTSTSNDYEVVLATTSSLETRWKVTPVNGNTTNGFPHVNEEVAFRNERTGFFLARKDATSLQATARRSTVGAQEKWRMRLLTWAQF